MEKTAGTLKDPKTAKAAAKEKVNSIKESTLKLQNIISHGDKEKANAARQEVKKKTGVDINDAKVRLGLAKAKEGASDINTNMQKNLSESREAQLKAYESASNRFIAALNDTFNTGALQFSKAILSALKERKFYEQLSGNTNEYSENLAKATRDMIDNLVQGLSNNRQLLPDIKGQIDKYESELDKKIPKNDEFYKEKTEYSKLQIEQARLQWRIAENPNDNEAKNQLAMILEQMKDMEKNAPEVNGKSIFKGEDMISVTNELSALMGPVLTIIKNTSQLSTAVESAHNQMSELFRNVFTQGEELIKRESISSALEKQRMTTKTVGINAGIGQTDDIIRMIQESTQANIHATELAKDTELKQTAGIFTAMMKDAESFKDEKLREEAIQKAINFKRLETLKIEQTYSQQVSEILEQKSKNISDAFAVSERHVQRMTSHLEAMKDFAATIGAPFEMILDIDKKRIDMEYQSLEIERKKLEALEDANEDQEAIAQQRLKYEQQQMKLVKMQYGMQHDFITRLIGKITGQFQEIGGIFNPAYVASKIFGQGYMKNPNGIMSSAGPNAFGGYQWRRGMMGGMMPGHSGQGWMPGMAKGGVVGSSNSKHMSFHDVQQNFGTHFHGEDGLERRSSQDTELALLKTGEKIIPEKGSRKSAQSLGVSDSGLADAYRKGNLLDYIIQNSDAIRHGINGYAKGRTGDNSSGSWWSGAIGDFINRNIENFKNDVKGVASFGINGVRNLYGLVTGDWSWKDNEWHETGKKKPVEGYYGLRKRTMEDDIRLTGSMGSQKRKNVPGYAKGRTRSYFRTGDPGSFKPKGNFGDFRGRNTNRKTYWEKYEPGKKPNFSFRGHGNRKSYFEKYEPGKAPNFSFRGHGNRKTYWDNSALHSFSPTRQRYGGFLGGIGRRYGSSQISHSSRHNSLNPPSHIQRRIDILLLKYGHLPNWGSMSQEDRSFLMTWGHYPPSFSGRGHQILQPSGMAKGGTVNASNSKHISFRDVKKLFGNSFHGEDGLERRSSQDTELALLKTGEKIIPEKGSRKSAQSLGVSDSGLADAYRKGNLLDYIIQNSDAITGIRGFAGGGSADHLASMRQDRMKKRAKNKQKNQTQPTIASEASGNGLNGNSINMPINPNPSSNIETQSLKEEKKQTVIIDEIAGSVESIKNEIGSLNQSTTQGNEQSPKESEAQALETTTKEQAEKQGTSVKEEPKQQETPVKPAFVQGSIPNAQPTTNVTDDNSNSDDIKGAMIIEKFKIDTQDEIKKRQFKLRALERGMTMNEFDKLIGPAMQMQFNRMNERREYYDVSNYRRSGVFHSNNMEKKLSKEDINEIKKYAYDHERGQYRTTAMGAFALMQNGVRREDINIVDKNNMYGTERGGNDYGSRVRKEKDKAIYERRNFDPSKVEDIYNDPQLNKADQRIENEKIQKWMKEQYEWIQDQYKMNIMLKGMFGYNSEQPVQQPQNPVTPAVAPEPNAASPSGVGDSNVISANAGNTVPTAPPIGNAMQSSKQTVRVVVEVKPDQQGFLDFNVKHSNEVIRNGLNYPSSLPQL